MLVRSQPVSLSRGSTPDLKSAVAFGAAHSCAPPTSWAAALPRTAHSAAAWKRSRRSRRSQRAGSRHPHRRMAQHRRHLRVQRPEQARLTRRRIDRRRRRRRRSSSSSSRRGHLRHLRPPASTALAHGRAAMRSASERGRKRRPRSAAAAHAPQRCLAAKAMTHVPTRAATAAGMVPAPPAIPSACARRCTRAAAARSAA